MGFRLPETAGLDDPSDLLFPGRKKIRIIRILREKHFRHFIDAHIRALRRQYGTYDEVEYIIIDIEGTLRLRIQFMKTQKDRLRAFFLSHGFSFGSLSSGALSLRV